MFERFTSLLEHRFDVQPERTLWITQRLALGFAAIFFVLISTLIVGFDHFFTGFNSVANLEIGDYAPQTIVATNAITFMSEALTEQKREEARNSVEPEFFPQDPTVARQQTQLAQQILDYIENIREDRYGTLAQKTNDISHITALTLDDSNIEALLSLSNDTWDSVANEIVTILQRIMRDPILESELQIIRRDILPGQVSIRFINTAEGDIIVAITEDLVRPNKFDNPEATELAREAAAAAVVPEERSFGIGQKVVEEGDEISELAYEALQQLELLTPEDLRAQQIARSFVASILVIVILGLYMARFAPHLIYLEPRTLSLLAAIFLLMLIATRFLGINGNIFLFPTASLALIYVAIIGPHIAIMATLGMALLVGIMTNNSLEIATLVAAGGIIGTLGLRRAERLNSFFVAGALIGVTNAAVVGIFSLAGPTANLGLDSLGTLLLVLFSGLLVVPTASFAVMYILTAAFNLPTTFKLLDLSQPSKPLLQRLLREAPGTYQHSLQVANLAEQAAEAIGADAQMTHVAALYHDIGKMLNPVFFSENQQHIDNPHDKLNDPHRSADIIISHVMEGDQLAKQYRLPNRIRDFIREHHGTTQVYVFYQRALEKAGGDPDSIDISDYTYPGPKPHSPETAVLMLADSCESAVRAIKPQSQQEIIDIVQNIMESKRKDHQLDDSNLTLNDLTAIQNVFVEVFKGLFHPRIDYAQAVKNTGRDSALKPPSGRIKKVTVKPPSKSSKIPPNKEVSEPNAASANPGTIPTGSTVIPPAATNSPVDDAPLEEVPPLPKASERRKAKQNGKPDPAESQDDKTPSDQKEE